MNVRDVFENVLLESVRFYTWNSPVRKGKNRVFGTTLSLCRNVPRERSIRLRDGRRLTLTYSRGRNDQVVFVGEYEPFLTEVCRELIEEGDVCVDVGANFGWYTTLFALLAGATGEVHAFEPVAQAFDELSVNVRAAPFRENIRVNKSALGDDERDIEINVFPEIGLGYSSISDRGRSDATPQRCSMTTLDSYWKTHGRRPISFIKADVEGAELLMLRGARSILRQADPPIMLLELADELTSAFGYSSADLLSFVVENAQYQFYAVDEAGQMLRRIDNWQDTGAATNVFCIPDRMTESRRRRLSRFVQ